MEHRPEDHLRLVHSVAQRFYRLAKSRGEDYEDIVQAGSIGLIQACQKFSPDYGVVFSTYAVRVIQGSISRHFRDSTYQLKFPRSVKELMNLIYRYSLNEATPDDIVERFQQCSKKTAEKALYASKVRTLSLHGPNASNNGEKETLLQDAIASQADFSSIVVADFMRSLSVNERRIVELRMEGRTQAEVGTDLGFTQAHISRTLVRIKDKLTSYLNEGRQTG